MELPISLVFAIAAPIVFGIIGYKDAAPRESASEKNISSGAAVGIGIISATLFRFPELLPAFFGYAIGRRVAGLVKK